MFAQMPLFVYRHFTGAVCTTSSDVRALHTGLLACIWAVKLIRHGALPDISEPRRANWSPVQRAQFKTFAWTTVAIVGAWHAVGRRLEPHARLCVAVAQVVKLKAGCVANSK